MIALIHIYCSTSLCVIYKSLLIHDIQVLIYRGSTNERLSGEGVAYDSYYNETDRVTISPQQVTTPDTTNQNTESPPQRSLPCGQQTPTSSTNTSDTPSPDTPPQPFVHSQPQPFTSTQAHHTSPKPHKPQDKQPSPVKTNVNPPTQPSIPDEETQHVPKSTNGNQVKCSKPQLRQ